MKHGMNIRRQTTVEEAPEINPSTLTLQRPRSHHTCGAYRSRGVVLVQYRMLP